MRFARGSDGEETRGEGEDLAREGCLRGETRGKGGFWSGLGGVRGGERATELLRLSEEDDRLGGGLGWRKD